MKITITESQLKRLVEDADLNSSFRNLKVNDILALVADRPEGRFEYKFKVVKDMGDYWGLVNLNFGSTNTGFDWFIEKTEAINDNKVVLIKMSKKDKTGSREKVTLKNIESAKLGDDVLDLARTDGGANKEEIEQAYGLALNNIKKGNPNMADDAAHDAAVAVIRQEFGDIPEVEIIDNAGYGKVNRGGRGGDAGAEDIDFTDTPKQFTIDGIKAEFVAGSGVLLELSNGDELRFNVDAVSNDIAEIELVSTNSNEYKVYEEVQFKLKLDTNNIQLSKDGSYINVNMNIIATGNTKTVTVNNIIKLNKVEFKDDDTGLSRKRLLQIIMADPVLKNAFTKTPTLMGLINIGDVKGISKAYDILNRTGFGLDDSDGDSGNREYADKFSQRYKVEIDLDDDVKFFTGEPKSINSGRKIVSVFKSGKKITLTDDDKNTYGILEALGGDRYRVNVQRPKDARTGGEKAIIRVLNYRTR